MECEIVIRAATSEDKQARAELIHRGVTSHDVDAIIFFIFQELTLQLSVLLGAVLFIFCGASLAVASLSSLVLATLVAFTVLAAHRANAHQHAARLRHELVGFVAEYRGPLCAAPATLAPRIVTHAGAGRACHRRVVGTLSVADYQGPRNNGWVHALAVDPLWQRRGVGSALLDASGAWARGEQLDSLETALSSLQAGARALLHTNGWELRGTYHRQLLGAALTLPMLHLGLTLTPDHHITPSNTLLRSPTL